MTTLIVAVAAVLIFAGLGAWAWRTAPQLSEKDAKARAAAGVEPADYVRALRWRMVVNVSAGAIVMVAAIVAVPPRLAASSRPLLEGLLIFVAAYGFAVAASYAALWSLNASVLKGFNDVYLKVHRARAAP